MLCSEYIELVYGGAHESVLGGCEACASLLAGHSGLWFGVQTRGWS